MRTLVYFNFRYPAKGFMSGEYPEITFFDINEAGGFPIDDVRVLIPRHEIPRFAKLLKERTQIR